MRIIGVLLLVSCCNLLHAQGVINNGAHIILGPGANLIIEDTLLGNFENRGPGSVKNEGTIRLQGNWLNNGYNNVFTSGSGTVELSGGNQKIGGTSVTAFYNLVLSGTGMKTLLLSAIAGGGNATNRNGLITLGNAILNLNSNTFFLTNSSPSAIQRNSGYILSETGPFSGYGKFAWITGTSTSGKNYIIPFGRIDGAYIPYSIKFTGNGSGSDSSGFIASTYPAPPLPGNRPLPSGVNALDNPYGKDHSENTLDRFWVNDAFGFTNPPAADLVFNYNDDEWNNANGGMNTIFENELGLISYISGKWKFPPSGVNDIINNQLSVSGTPAFGIFSLANPVECPTVSFGFQNDCQLENIYFSDSSNFRKGYISSHAWDFGDASVSSDSSSFHAFKSAGSFKVKKIVTLNSGCSDTIEKTVTVYPKPVARYTFNGNQCLGNDVVFKDISVTPQGLITNRFWEFGDGQLSNSSDPTITYSAAGIFNARLVVENTWACRDTISKQVRIFNKPLADFLAGDACSRDLVIPLNQSQEGDAPLRTFSWDLGDGSSSFDFQPAKKYKTPGTYTIRLIVKDSANCSDTAEKTISVNPNAVADFDHDPVKPDFDDPLVSFINRSSGSNSWSWDFGDGSSGSNFNIQHIYGDTGYYTVILRADNDFNCPDTMSKRIYIEPVFHVFVPNSFTPNGDLVNDTFGPEGMAMGAKNCSFKIYNRWGGLIFAGTEIDHRWDGSYNGEPVQTGVYSWTFESDDYKGRRHSYSGVVTLLR